MGNSAVSIADALFSQVQQRVLGVLFGHPERSFYANEIARLAATGRGALQRELERLTRSGLATMTEIGRQKHYQANREAPIFAELVSIARKTFGVADVLREALAPLSPAIRTAFIYGSLARGADTAASDIDLLVIADGLGYSELFEALSGAETALGRKVNPTLYSAAEVARKQVEGNAFVERVGAQPKIMLVGEAGEFAARQPG